MANSADLSGNAGQWGLIGALIQKQGLLTVFLSLLSFGIVYLFVVYYTHRIAGPVYRFSRALDAMARGELGTRIHLRRNDYFVNLGDSLNRASDALQLSVEELRTHTAAIIDLAQKRNDADLVSKAHAIEKILERYQASKT